MITCNNVCKYKINLNNMEYRSGKKVVGNINKLMAFWELNVEKLSETAGLSASGTYQMLKSQSFKLEALEKIATALTVPLSLLFSDELEAKRDFGENKRSITFKWKINDLDQFVVLNDGENLTTVFYMNNETMSEQKDQITELLGEVGMYQDKIQNKDVMIEFYTEQIESYKEMIAGLKFLNEKLIKSFPDNIQPKEQQ